MSTQLIDQLCMTFDTMYAGATNQQVRTQAEDYLKQVRNKTSAIIHT